MKAGLILSVGHPWDEAKNVQGLARIAKELPWPVCVAGPDQDPAGKRISLPDCMMLGQVSEEELARWYARTSIYASPARYAPFDYSILGAALAGCALVLGDIPSLRETWRGAAVFIPPNDVAVLRYTLRELTAQPRWRELMALRARTRAHMFTAARMAEQYMALYDGVREERAVCAS
jgi:glycosyltransferase involved in cell wall biosynthesis